MTKITIRQIVGWSVAGGLMGGGALILPIPHLGVALVAAGLALLSLVSGLVGCGVTILAAIVAVSPAIMPDLPAWAALFISTVIYLIAIDLSIRFA